jgi:hypothetical protein
MTRRDTGRLARAATSRRAMPSNHGATTATSDLAEIVDRVDVGDDGMMAGALEPLLIERTVRAPADGVP